MEREVKEELQLLNLHSILYQGKPKKEPRDVTIENFRKTEDKSSMLTSLDLHF